MNAGDSSELSRKVICWGFEKSSAGPTRKRSALGRKFLSVSVPARVDANTTLPSGANTGSKLCTRTLGVPIIRPASLVSRLQVPAPTSSSHRSRPVAAPTRAAKMSLLAVVAPLGPAHVDVLTREGRAGRKRAAHVAHRRHPAVDVHGRVGELEIRAARVGVEVEEIVAVRRTRHEGERQRAGGGHRRDRSGGQGRGALDAVPLLEHADGAGVGRRIERLRAGIVDRCHVLEQGSGAVGRTTRGRHDVLLHGPRLLDVDGVERHELGQQGLVVALERQRREESLRARAQAEVVEAVGAVAPLERAAPLQELRHDVVLEEVLPGGLDPRHGRGLLNQQRPVAASSS